MRLSIAVVALSLTAGVANAQIPTVNATCPTAIEFHSDEGGPAYINGKEAKLKSVNATYFTASRDGIEIEVMINPDKTVMVSYTGKHGANGICQVADDTVGGSAGGCPPDVTEADRYKYPACN